MAEKDENNAFLYTQQPIWSQTKENKKITIVGKHTFKCFYWREQKCWWMIIEMIILIFNLKVVVIIGNRYIYKFIE